MSEVDVNALPTSENMILAEPNPRIPVIDGEGFAWVWERDDEDDDEYHWVRRVYSLMMDPDKTGRRMMSGPPLGSTWDEDVVFYGPIRRATPADNLGWRFLYYPEGYHQGSPVGKYVVLDSPNVPEAYIQAGGK